MPNFTKDAIKSAFVSLLNRTPLNKITVRSIVEECGINRNSFYYHFQDIPSLLEEIVRDRIDRIIAEYPTINSLDECAELAFKFALENKKAVLNIYDSVNRGIYEQYLMRLCEYVVTTYLDTVFGKDSVNSYDRSIAIRFLKCELFGLSFDWIASGMKKDVIDEICHVNSLCRGFSEEVMRRMGKTDSRSG